MFAQINSGDASQPRELQASWLTLEVKYPRVRVSNHLILHSKLEMELQLVLENKTNMLSKGKLLPGSPSLSVPKIKNKETRFPSPSAPHPTSFFQRKCFLNNSKNLATWFQYINLAKA